MLFVLLQTFCLQETIKASRSTGPSASPEQQNQLNFCLQILWVVGSLWSQVWFCSKHNWIQNNIWLLASVNLPDKINWSAGDRAVFAHTKPTEPESRRDLDKLQKAQEFNWKTPTLIYLLEESPASDKDRRLHFPPSGPFLLPKKLPKYTNQTTSPPRQSSCHQLLYQPSLCVPGGCFYHAGNCDFPLVPALRTEINKELSWPCGFCLINLVRRRREEAVGHRLALYLGLGNASDQLQDGAFIHCRSTTAKHAFKLGLGQGQEEGKHAHIHAKQWKGAALQSLEVSYLTAAKGRTQN